VGSREEMQMKEEERRREIETRRRTELYAKLRRKYRICVCALFYIFLKPTASKF